MNAGGNRNGDEQCGDPRRMERCPACGRRQFHLGRCHACGLVTTHSGDPDGRDARPPLPVDRGTSFHQNGIIEGHFGLHRANPSAVPGIPQSTPPVRRTENTAVFPPPPAAGGSQNSISGRVLYISPLAHEPMDFDPWRWVAIPTWGLVLLATPVAGTLTAWEFGGPLVALAVAAVLLLVLRYVFSNRLIDSWYLIAALNGRQMVESMPVQVVRIRQWDGHEAQLRLKGAFANGAVMEGDRIEATGRWKRGVFDVSESTCQRTGARITPHQPRAKSFALTGLAVLAGMILWILIAGLAVGRGFAVEGLPVPLPVDFPISHDPLPKR